ncbi:MAG: DUF58 domain-containing protein [Halobacteria archaeon]|nr:DUF58 domain-containing protein [Halobacteria archaeon]
MLGVRLTRRGWAALGVLAVAEASALGFGARSLNYVAAPLGAVFVVSGLRVARLSRSDFGVSVEAPETVFEDDEAEITVVVESETEAKARLDVDLQTGRDSRVSLTDSVFLREGTHDFRRHVSLPRGVYGSVSVGLRLTDYFGLFYRTESFVSQTELAVVPRPYVLRSSAVFVSEGDGLPRETSPDRGSDTVRAYEVGDPLKDVDWRLSAGSVDGLLVRDYVSASESDSEDTEAVVSVSVPETTRRETADEAARAAASLLLLLSKRGYEVGLRTSRKTTEAGDASFDSFLRHLAAVGLSYGDDRTSPDTSETEVDDERASDPTLTVTVEDDASEEVAVIHTPNQSHVFSEIAETKAGLDYSVGNKSSRGDLI